MLPKLLNKLRSLWGIISKKTFSPRAQFDSFAYIVINELNLSSSLTDGSLPHKLLAILVTHILCVDSEFVSIKELKSISA